MYRCIALAIGLAPHPSVVPTLGDPTLRRRRQRDADRPVFQTLLHLANEFIDYLVNFSASKRFEYDDFIDAISRIPVRIWTSTLTDAGWSDRARSNPFSVVFVSTYRKSQVPPLFWSAVPRLLVMMMIVLLKSTVRP